MSRVLTKDAETACRHIDAKLEFKAEDVTPSGRFKGYASVFNIVDQGGDCVLPGAFVESIVEAKSTGRLIPMLWQHDRNEPLGTWPDLAEDAKGLFVEGQLVLDDNPLAKRAHSLLKAKALGGLSIGYRIPAAGAEEDSKRRGVYLLKKLGLIEISVVTMPMLLQARVSQIKSILSGGARPTVSDLQGALLEIGFEADLAKAIADHSRPLLDRVEEKGMVDPTAALYSALEARLGRLA